MKRFLGLALLTCATATAGEPVSVFPPIAPIPAAPTAGGSLSQSLPNLIRSTAPTTAVVAPPPPVMTGQSSWATPQPLVQTNWDPPIARSPTPCAPANGCGSRGSLLERLRAWVCGGSGPAVHPMYIPTPYRVPVRDYFPPVIVASGGEGYWPSKCEARGGHGAAGCAPAAVVGPRPITIPLPSAGDGCAAPRPGLLRRLVDFLAPGCFGRAACAPAGVPLATTTYAVVPGYHLAGQQPVVQPVAYEPPAANRPFTAQK